MSCRQVGFALGTCVVEINPEIGDPLLPVYTVSMSYVENDGAVLRPVVSENGGRVRIRAGSEPLALTSAIGYLRARFGTLTDAGHPCSMGDAAVGRPLPIG
jgi:hypothetical protein